MLDTPTLSYPMFHSGHYLHLEQKNEVYLGHHWKNSVIDQSTVYNDESVTVSFFFFFFLKELTLLFEKLFGKLVRVLADCL